MDHPAALYRIKVGVPATVEHSSEAGPETGKWVAETTQVRVHSDPVRIHYKKSVTELHYFYGRPETATSRQGPATSYLTRTRHWIRAFQEEQGLGRAQQDGRLVSVLSKY